MFIKIDKVLHNNTIRIQIHEYISVNYALTVCEFLVQSRIHKSVIILKEILNIS